MAGTENFGRRPGRIVRCLFLLFCLSLWPIPGFQPVLAGEWVSLSGITEAIHDVTLSADVDGWVSRIYFDEGDTVKKGQRILELHKALEELELERRTLIWETKVEVESAKTQIRTMKSLLERTRNLFESTRSVSQEELEEKQLEYDLALAEHQRLEIEEEKQRIEHEMALESLRRKIVESPIDGVIIKLFLDEGESCEAEQPLVQVVDTKKCLLVCTVEEHIGRTLKKRQTVPLKIRTGNTTLKKKGYIAFVSPVVDPASGLLEVKVAFSNPDGAVRPGVAGFMLLKTP